MLEINRGGVVGSLSVGWKGGNRPDTPGHWRVGVPGKKEGGRGADGGTEEGVGGGGPGGPRGQGGRDVGAGGGGGNGLGREEKRGGNGGGREGHCEWPREGHELRIWRGAKWGLSGRGEAQRPSTH